MAGRSTISRDWLNAKFASIENKLDEHGGILREHLKQDRTDFDDLGSKLEIHNVRVDRLEQSEKRRLWNARALWTAAIGGFFAGVAGLAVALLT